MTNTADYMFNRSTKQLQGVWIWGVYCGAGDQQVGYDERAARWYAVSNSYNGVGPCLAVSQTADPMNGPWNVYILSNQGGDQPTVGWNSDIIVVTDAFGGGTTSYVVDKADAIAGNPVNIVWTRQGFETKAARPGQSIMSYAYAVERGANDSNIFVWRFNGRPPNTRIQRAAINVPQFFSPGPFQEGQATLVTPPELQAAAINVQGNRLFAAVEDGPGASIRVFEIAGIDSFSWPPFLAGSSLFTAPGVTLQTAALLGDWNQPDLLWVGMECSAPWMPLSLCMGTRRNGNYGGQGVAVVKGGQYFYGRPGETNLRTCDFITATRDWLFPQFGYLFGCVSLDGTNLNSWNLQFGATCSLNTRTCQ